MTETTELTNETDKVVTIDIILTPEEINPSDFDWPIDETICHEYADFLATNIKYELKKFDLACIVDVTYNPNPVGYETDYRMFSPNISHIVWTSIQHALSASFLFFFACKNRSEWRQAFEHHNRAAWNQILDNYMSGSLSSSGTGSAGPSDRPAQGRSFNSTRRNELTSTTQEKASHHNSPIIVDIRLTPNNLHPAGFGDPVNVSMGHQFANFLRTNIVYEMQRRAIPSSVHVTYVPNPDEDEGDHQAFSINTSDEVIELIRHVWIASWQWWQSCQTLEDWRQVYMEQSLSNWSAFFDGYWNAQITGYQAKQAKPAYDIDDLVTIDIRLTPENIKADNTNEGVDDATGHAYAEFLSANLRHELKRLGVPCGVHVAYVPNPDGSEHDHPMFSDNISEGTMSAIHNVLIASWNRFHAPETQDEWQEFANYPNRWSDRYSDVDRKRSSLTDNSESKALADHGTDTEIALTFRFSRNYVTPDYRRLCDSTDFIDDFGSQLANVMEAVIRDFCKTNDINATLDIQFLPELSEPLYERLSGPIKVTERLAPNFSRLIEDVWHGFKMCQSLNDWRQFHDYHVYGANRVHPIT